MSSSFLSRQNVFILALVAGVFELAGAVIQASTMLSSVGVASVFSALSLASADKVNFALYLTFLGACFSIVLWGGAEVLRVHARRGGMIACMAVVSVVVTLLLPSALGYPSSGVGLALTALATVLTAGVAYTGF